MYGEKRNAYWVLVEMSEGERNLGNVEWIVQKYDRRAQTGLIFLALGTNSELL